MSILFYHLGEKVSFLVFVGCVVKIHIIHYAIVYLNVMWVVVRFDGVRTDYIAITHVYFFQRHLAVFPELGVTFVSRRVKYDVFVPRIVVEFARIAMAQVKCDFCISDICADFIVFANEIGGEIKDVYLAPGFYQWCVNIPEG